MKFKLLSPLFVLSVLLCLPAYPATPKPAGNIMPLSQVRAGMRGVAYTVFQGTEPEPMEVEILGVQKNVTGPKGDLILVRLHGSKPEYTGVVAGMSGSPVYVDGKLIGALSYRIGDFSKEPIGSVTPIGQMMEISDLDSSAGSEPVSLAPSQTSQPGFASRTFSPGIGGRILQPIDTPLVFNGFSEETLRQFAPQLGAAGITPVMGAGSMSDEKQPEPLVPGSAVSMVLVRGDMDIAATCTVTYADADRLLACGHPVLQFGAIDVPMNKARVMATLASPLNSFKIVNTTEPAGAFVQDRHSGILGRFGRSPEMIPVTLTVHGSPQPKTFHYEVLNNARLTPVVMMATVDAGFMVADCAVWTGPTDPQPQDQWLPEL